MYRELRQGGGRRGGELAPATVRRIHATLHRALKDAVAWGYLLRNPAAVAVKPKQQPAGSVHMRVWSLLSFGISCCMYAMIASSRCGASQQPPGCAAVNCWGCAGRTSTSTHSEWRYDRH
jgi:hypothetical protein